MSYNKKCKHYREEGTGADLGWKSGCTCNNNVPHDIGECVYGDGIVKGIPICKYYEQRESEALRYDEIDLNNPACLLGNVDNDCEGCPYASDYYYLNGDCVPRDLI